jgi:hypothetical protein
MTEVAIEELTSGDAGPTAAPFKISAQATKDSLTFKVKATAGSLIHAIRVRLTPLDRNNGQLLFSRGMVCGSGDRCGTPHARSLSQSSPFTTSTVTINEAEVAEQPDGEYEVKAWAMAEEGWS